jgi:4-amino-4-deoxy-L-arabinose transferase-like glycosyltransferase
MVKDYWLKKNVPFNIFTAGILIFLTVPTLIQDGMFLDGMLYTCVSHNLSNGIGTFWFPQYSPSYFNAGSPFFQEHPPLVFGIQSLFFKLLGDSMYVERLYTLLAMCLSAFLINLLWKNIYKDNEGLRKISWLPVLIWITIPACFWSYSNNMMENTMGIFALSAVILIYKASESERNENGILLLSGFFIFLATMSKGVPGLFPLSLPFLFWLIFRRKSFLKMVLQTMLIVSVPALLYLILFSLPQSHESLTFYVTKRLLGRINDNPTVGSRFYILKRLFNELLPQIILTITVLFVTKLKKTKKPVISNILPAVFFFSIGLAATAPMILTLVQRGFYLVPSFPYFAIGFSILIAPIVLDFTNKIYMRTQHFKIYLILSIVIFVFAISFSILQKGKTVRDRDMLHDVHAIGNTIPAKSAVTVNQDIANTYVLECYFIRYYDISLFIDEPKDYLMVKKTENQVISDNFEKLNIDTKVYDVYMKK